MKYLMSGNEAVARGAYEAGIVYASAYPGTPSTEILENTANYKEIISEWAPNEKVALESVFGASVAGVRTLAAMKHVGVNVAADPLMSISYTGVVGGLVLVSADDPGCHSSQNEQDNRYYAKFAKIPCIEPSDSQECKDFVKAAVEISEKFETAVLYRMTTRVCHSKSLVEYGERAEKAPVPYEKKPQRFITSPANAIKRHPVVEERLKALEEFSNECELNRVIWGDKKIGVIASGAAFNYAREVFGDTASYFKIGFSFPLPMKKLREFADKVETLYVVEELEPFIEEQLRAEGIKCIGKEKVPRCNELNPEIIAEALLGKKPDNVHADEESVVGRPPTLCSGCPHRGFFYALSKKKNVMITGDIGCYTLGSAPPLSATDTVLCMGASVSMGHGASRALQHAGSKLRSVCVIGDSTFFHSGITSLMHTAYNKAKTVTVILDNRITGMTGHQDNPGTGYTLSGDPTEMVDIPSLVKSIGIKHVKTVNPLRLKEVDAALEEAFALDEASVIICRWPCALKKMTQLDITEFKLEKQYVCYVDEDTCIGCKMCTKTGCPSVVFQTDKKKSSIDYNTCIGCEVCLQVCPVGAIKKREK